VAKGDTSVKSFGIGLGFMFLALGSGCFHSYDRTFVVGAVNPKPSIAIDREVGPVSIEVLQIHDVQTPQVPHWNRPAGSSTYLVGETNLVVKDFQATLRSGFRNAVGRHYREPATGTAKLVLDQADIQLVDIPSMDASQPPDGRFVTIAYKGRWLDSQGNVVSEVSGVAEPRFQGEKGPRHLEDVVEVMYENVLKGLASLRGVPVRADANPMAQPASP
jgi:hypothetical protein